MTSRTPTARAAHRKLTPIVLPDDYVCPDPEPEERPDMQQAPTVHKSGYFVSRHFAHRPDVLVDSGGFVFYNQYSMNYRFNPDLYVALDVDRAAIRQRNGYVVWEAGKPPDFALEVASETTHRRDTGEKPGLYASVGITEYWRVDPTGGDLYGYALAGDVLVDGVYHPIDLHAEDDGTIWGYSAVLDLCLCWNPSWYWDVDDESRLRFYDRKAERYLCDISLVEAERDAAVTELQAAQQRIRELEAQLQSHDATSQGA